MIKLFGKPEMVLNDYKKTSLYFAVGLSCTFKCMRDLIANGVDVSEFDCHNSHLTKSIPNEYSNEDLQYLIDRNPFCDGFVLAGLEPMDSFENTFNLVKLLREKYDKDIVIYTGYEENELCDEIHKLKTIENIIIKFGRFDPRYLPEEDDELGIILSTGNQYAKRIS